MEIITKYVADDGTVFSTEWECLDYEEQEKDKLYNNTVFLFNQCGERIPLHSNFEEVYIIYTTTDEATQYLSEKYSDWVNPWYRENNSIEAGCWIFIDEKWIPAKKIFEIADFLKKIMQNTL